MVNHIWREDYVCPGCGSYNRDQHAASCTIFGGPVTLAPQPFVMQSRPGVRHLAAYVKRGFWRPWKYWVRCMNCDLRIGPLSGWIAEVRLFDERHRNGPDCRE